MVGTQDHAQLVVAQQVPRSQQTQPDPVFPHPLPRVVPGAQHPQPHRETPSLEAADRAGSGHPIKAVTSLSRPPARSDSSFHRAQQLLSPTPHSPPGPAGPPCPRILHCARLKHPAGGWERLAALPRRFSFIKHKAGGGFSHAVGMVESLFSAASGRKMEEGKRQAGPCPLLQPAGRPAPLFSFQRWRQKDNVTEGLKI